MIKFAVLGVDETVLPLLESLAEQRQPVVMLHDVPGAWQTSCAAWFPAARQIAEWDELLALDRDTVVIVSRGANDDLRAEQLRKLIQNGQALVVSQPPVDSMVVLFELEMIRRDTGAVIVPWSPDRWSTNVATISDQLRAATWGQVEQLVIERPLVERSKSTVLRQFARDAGLARAWCGDLTKVSALASGADFGNLNVQMSGPGGTLVRWSALGSATNSTAKVTIVGVAGQATFELPPPVASPADADRLIDDLTRRLRGEGVAPSWHDACRELELADAVERSAAKGKTIELYLEEVNEENTFKGMMAAGGCLLLLITLPLIVLATTLTNLELPFVGYWPYGLLLVLAIFLLLQTLRLAFPPREER